jgi:8-oxo-dGTP pyrophosphatase MutT (NUDIX family)
MQAAWRRAAAYVLCHDDAGRILLTRFALEGHPDSGKWTMPGGAMEWGEQPVETAARELEEETGLHANLGPVLGVFSRWFEPHEAFTGEAGHVLGVVFEGTDDGRRRVVHAGGSAGAPARRVGVLLPRTV